MRTIAFVAATLATAACDSGPTPLQEAEKRYNYLASHNAMPDELCRAAKAAKEAAVDAAVKAEGAQQKRDADLAHATWSITEMTRCRL